MDGGSFQSSRIIVKNLPKKITPERLKAHFSAKGHVTDLKLAHTPAGVFRRFAYIGFSCSEEAQSSVAHFNRSFIDTSRIQVELARPVNDPSLPRPWSKYSAGSSAHDRKSPAQVAAEEEATKSAVMRERERLAAEMERKRKFLLSIYGEEDAEMSAFLHAMKPKSRTKTWENDDDSLVVPTMQTTKKKSNTKKKKAPKVEIAAVPSKKAGGSGILLAKSHVKFEESESDDEETAIVSGSESDGLYEDFFDRKDPEKEVSSNNEMEISSNNEVEERQKVPETKVQSLDPSHIAENGRLFVRNLSYSCTEADLRALFEPFGPLVEVHLPISRETKQVKGFAYILFMIPENAVSAFTQLDGTIFQGRLLHILPAADREEKRPSLEDASGSSSFKRKKMQDLQESSKKDFNWNSLFIRTDTVLDAIAANLGVPKSSIMDVRSDNLATRLAIAETTLIQETKAYLEAAGVCLDSFGPEAKVARSDTVILVKNLPFETEVSEIRALFAKHGHLDRVILPPATKAIAMVEFLEANEARSAFKHLAYSKFKHVPLYLEWAPMACLRPKVEVTEEATKEVIPQNQPPDESDVNLTGHLAAHTLYVTNLNFTTQEDTLKQVFSAAGPVRSVKIPTKMRNNQRLSLGFGFVEFERRSSVTRALDQLQGVKVDEHALVLKIASSSSSSSAQSYKKSKNHRVKTDTVPPENTSTKLIVRNIPFEATDREIKDLFKNFTQVKRVRIPRKFNGSHRGFGFIEFMTHQEAANALTQLGHTHLYGRHLVLEWAKTDAAVEDDLHRQAERDAAALTGMSKKHSKVSLTGDADEDDEDDLESSEE